MGFSNLVVDSDDEDDDIFKPDRRFSDVFNEFNNSMNQGFAKKDKNVFKLALLFSPEILKYLKLTHREKFNVPREIKMP